MSDEMKRCEASTTKKAWNNPLAPMAKCTRAAVARMRWPFLERSRECVCSTHAKVYERRGWVREATP